MDEISQRLKGERGNASLMENHTKKLQKKEKEDKDKPKERRPFDRDIDLQVNYSIDRLINNDYHRQIALTPP